MGERFRVLDVVSCTEIVIDGTGELVREREVGRISEDRGSSAAGGVERGRLGEEGIGGRAVGVG